MNLAPEPPVNPASHSTTPRAENAPRPTLNFNLAFVVLQYLGRRPVVARSRASCPVPRPRPQQTHLGTINGSRRLGALRSTRVFGPSLLDFLAHDEEAMDDPPLSPTPQTPIMPIILGEGTLVGSETYVWVIQKTDRPDFGELIDLYLLNNEVSGLVFATKGVI